MISVQEAPFDPADEERRLAQTCPAAGAIVSFTGLVRGRSDGVEVSELELDHHPRFTEKMVREIAEDARARFSLLGVTIIHRYGRLRPGEPIVLAAAAAENRRAAFDAVDYLMDRLKTEAPFWKREHGPDRSRWIEARPEDWTDRARWDRGG
jgi:molybdopterin synthase catalytic subunit